MIFDPSNSQVVITNRGVNLNNKTSVYNYYSQGKRGSRGGRDYLSDEIIFRDEDILIWSSVK